MRELLDMLRATAAEDRQRAAELNSKEALLSVQEKLLSNKDEEIQRLLREIQSLKASRSWRITAPLRLVDRLLSRKGHFLPNLMEEAVSLAWRAGVRLRLTRRTKELHNQIRRICDAGLFDFPWYRDRYGKMPGAEGHPILHYLRIGAKHGCDPNPHFDTNWYLNQYPEVAAAGINPLIHYIECGTKHGYNPGPLFDTISYLENHPDVRDAGINPLSHYLLRCKGMGESRESDMRPTLYAYRPDFEAWNKGDKRVLVFASDILPLGGLPSSGGGLRSWQIINMLKAKGWNVRIQHAAGLLLYQEALERFDRGTEGQSMDSAESKPSSEETPPSLDCFRACSHLQSVQGSLALRACKRPSWSREY